jgi:hypothetical protein
MSSILFGRKIMSGIGVGELLLVSCVIVLVVVVAATALLVILLRPGSGSTGRHVELEGLESDDHLQYMLSTGARPMLGDLDMGGNRIDGLPAAEAQGQAVPFEQALKSGDAASGDLSGAFPNLQVVGLQGQPVSPIPPAIGQVLVWNGSEWEPRDLPGESSPSD